MKKLFSSFLLLLMVFHAFSQEECGTEILPEQKQLLENLEYKWEEKRKTFRINATSMKMVPVRVHIIRQSNGTGGITISEVQEALKFTNSLYINANIQFFICGAENYIDNDAFYSFDKSEESSLRSIAYISGMLNIYFAETVTSGSSGLCGYAYFPGSYDFVMMDNSCSRNGSTLAHEIGHYFNLYHTHQSGNELVNGSNCSTAGDRCCDTPADNELTGNVGAGCVYTGTDVDANGDPYNPSTTNLMSYSTKACRFEFTPEQYARMKYAADNYRTYLTCNSSVPLEAEFLVNEKHSCSNSLNVQFSSTTLGTPTGWSWNFGDGSPVSTNENPAHTYNIPGVYNVSLTANKEGVSDTETKNYLVSVGAVTLPYTENFETGEASLGKFKKQTGFANYINVLNDGATSGSYGLVLEGLPNTNVSYNTPTTLDPFGDKVNPMFRAKTELCIDATSYSTLNLSFDLRQVYYINNAYTNFRVLVNGNQIGDVYRPAGATTAWNTINLDLTSYAGTVFTIGFESSCKYSRNYNSTSGNANYIDNINITGTQMAVADFTSDIETACLDDATVTFMDNSIEATAWSWNFGEGATPATSNTQGPHTVTYSSSGKKTVSLSINNGAITKTNTDYINVIANPVMNITPVSQEICSGSQTNLILTSNTQGSTFSWTTVADGGVTGMFPGSGQSIAQILVNMSSVPSEVTYTVTPEVSGCTGTASEVTVTVLPVPDISATVVNSQLCSNDITDIALASNVSGTQFNWTADYSSGLTGTNAGMGDQITERLILSEGNEGTATFTITPDFSGCTGNPYDVVINVEPCLTGMEVSNNSTIINITPNPFTEYAHLIVNTTGETIEVTIMDITGKVVFTGKGNTTRWQIGEKLESGIYFCIVKGTTGIEVHKLVKN